MGLKQALEETALRLENLETAARKLQNQNFADIVKAARSRVVQLTQHPDGDAVERALADSERPAVDPARPVRLPNETDEAYSARLANAGHGPGAPPPFPAAQPGTFPGPAEVD